MIRANKYNKIIFIIICLIFLVFGLKNKVYAYDYDGAMSCTDMVNNKWVGITYNKDERAMESGTGGKNRVNNFYTINKDLNTYKVKFTMQIEAGVWDGAFENPVIEKYDKNKMDLNVKIEDEEYAWKNSCKVVAEVTFKEKGEHEFVIRVSSKNAINVDVIHVNVKNVTLSLKMVEEAQKQQERMENLETFYQKSINELTTAQHKVKYLGSVLYNDSLNGNTVLWNKFVSKTTPEQRVAWKKDITLNWRNSDPEYQSVIDALAKQIEVDNGTATEEELNNSMNEARTGSTKSI